MIKRHFAQAVLALVAAVVCAGAQAQGGPTALKGMEIWAWGGATGAYTGIYGSRNLSVTAGAGLSLRPFHGVRPGVEVRGTLPLMKGNTAAEKNFLVGVNVSKNVFPRMDVYGDFLFGRGKIDYLNGGLISASGTFRYLYSTSNVWSPGGGVEYHLTRRVSLKGDVQLQRYQTPFTQTFLPIATPVATPGGGSSTGSAYIIDSPGHAVSKAITAGVKYRFNYGRHPL